MMVCMKLKLQKLLSSFLLLFSALNAIVEAQVNSPKPYLLKPYQDGPEASTFPQCQEPGVTKCKKFQVKTPRLQKLESGKTFSFRKKWDVVLKVGFIMLV